MHIAIFMYSAVAGGTGRISVALANALARRDCRVDYVVVRRGGAREAELSDSVSIVGLGAPRVSHALLPLWSYLRRNGPDVILGLDSRTTTLACWATMLAGGGCKVVASEHAVPGLDEAAPARTAVPFYVRWSYRRTAAVIAVSAAVADALAPALRRRRDEIAVLYNPVVDERILQASTERVTHPWFTHPGPPVVVAAGRLALVKGFDTLLRAFAELRRRRDARLAILGGGGDFHSLKALARDLRLSEDVWMPGHVPNPYPYLRRAAVFVSASRHEALPTAVIEAQALGVPVVATDCPGGIREAIHRDYTRHLVPVDDPVTLGDAISHVLAHPPDTSALQRRADEIAARFGVDRAVDQYLWHFSNLERQPDPAVVCQPE